MSTSFSALRRQKMQKKGIGRFLCNHWHRRVILWFVFEMFVNEKKASESHSVS